jgi:hypothetical protein
MFRREARPRSRRRFVLCFACKPPAPWPKSVGHLLLYGATVIAMAACELFGRFDDALYLFIVTGSFVALSPIVVVIHELGHAAAARMIGNRIYVIAFGAGPAFAAWRFGELQITFGQDLMRGYICSYPVSAQPRWRTSLYCAAGAAANVAAALITAAALSAAPPVEGAAPALKIALSLGAGFILSNVLTVVLTMIPRSVRMGDRTIPSDGRRLVELWRRPAARDYAILHDSFRGHRLLAEKRWRDARTHLAAAWDGSAARAGFLAALLHVIDQDEGREAALACYLEHRAAVEACADPPALQHAYVWSSAAWLALRSGAPSNFELADALSERALAVDASAAALQATRGAVLMAKGERDAGRTLLIKGLRETADRAAKAEILSFLVEQTSLDGDAIAADRFAALERHFLAAA